MEAVAKLGINPIYLLSQIVVFGVLAFLMVKLLYNPILNVLDKRKEQIAKGIEDARRAEEARAKADQEAARIIEEARKQSQQIIAEANTGAEQVRTSIKLQAEEEAKKILIQADEDADQRRDQILSEMRGQIGVLAISAAQRIIGESLDEKRQQALIQEFFSGVKTGQIAALEAVELVGKSAIITSALPLDDAEKQTYRALLIERLGKEAQIAFKTDPAIMGGVVVQVGDQVVDDSVAGRLGSMKDRLAAG